MNKRYNVKGLNGVYLGYQSTQTPTLNNYVNELIRDYDFFPMDNQMANTFSFKNASYSNPNKIIGSNTLSNVNSIFAYSEISKKNDIIPGKLYYNKFKFHFNFTESDLGSFKFDTLNNTQTIQVLNGLRIKLYVEIGSTKIPLKLENLQIYRFNNSVSGDTWTVQSNTNSVLPSGSTISSTGTTTGIQLSTGLNNEDCIDMRYGKQIFDTFKKSPNNYTFRVDVSFPDIIKITENNKFNIVIRYFNIGVPGVPSPYNTSESVNLMSNNYTYYERL